MKDDLIVMTALDPKAAEQAGEETHTFLAMVEGVLSAMKLDRLSLVDRRRVAVIVKQLRPDVPIPRDQMNLVVNYPAKSHGLGGKELSEELQENVDLTVRMVEIAAKEHLDVDNYDERSKLALLVAKKYPEAVGLRPREQATADALGSTARLHRLKEIAEEKGLDLGRPTHLARAERVLFEETRSTVRDAVTFEECLNVILRDARLDANDPSHRASAALEVAKRRPDLTQWHRTPSEPPKPEELTLFAQRAATFEEHLRQELVSRRIPEPKGGQLAPGHEQQYREAVEHVLRTHPDLTPAYK